LSVFVCVRAHVLVCACLVWWVGGVVGGMEREGVVRVACVCLYRESDVYTHVCTHVCVHTFLALRAHMYIRVCVYAYVLEVKNNFLCKSLFPM